ncbi:ABC transporter substrate-binding protein [Azospirillum sp.]|uniref:ABC transporter substrate-binding protein n=1 Tax=Azospirillum sp. TaxID=34012 RepID=UPI002D4908D8|nr:ABC transporter substrate-binding protein [Azospirillum sp.]HYD66197.1 ABC transporter substrate-binding protein [Azospirillum sp.]
MLRRTILRAAAAAALLLTAGTAPCVTWAAEPVTIRVGYAAIGVGNRPFVGGSSAALAHAEGYLEAEFRNDPDVKVEWFFFKGAGPAVNEAIANGQLDFALQGDLPSLIGRSNGLKTRLLLASGARSPIYVAVPPGSDIKAIKDLKGRKVAIFRGTNLHLAFDKVLAANGLSEKDLKAINMDFATSKAALATKDIDAALGQSDLLALEEQGIAKVIYTSKGDNPAFGRNAHVLVTEAFEAKHPALTARAVKAFVKASLWASDEANREKLFEIWAKSGIPAANFRAEYEGTPLALRNSPLFDPFLIDQYRIQARQAKEHGLIRRDVEVEGWFDLRYLDAALKELGLETRWTRYGADGKAVGS